MPPGPMNARFFLAWRFDSDGSLPSASASRPWIRVKSNPSNVLGTLRGSLLSLSSISITESWCFLAR